MDEFVTLAIADDKLTAEMRVMRVDEKVAFSVEQVEQYLQSYGVVYGLRHEVLKKFAESPQGFSGQTIVVAEGQAPVKGEDGKIVSEFDWESEGVRPQTNEDGTVDYKEVVKLKNVKKGELIAERILATAGQAGMLVTGEVAAAKDGREAYFKVGKNVVTDPEKMKLYAAIDGLITKTEKDKINVFPVYEVNGDVDYNIGNIDFVGNVVIRGNVLTGFRIRAAGDIRVVGGIEGAELEAGGSIDITAGITANHKGLIKAGENVKTSFILEGNVEADKDVIVSQSIMHSKVKAGKDVICNGAKGLVVGGVIQAGERVVARTVGNSTSTVTVIEVGVLPELRNELVELRSQIKSLEENLMKTEQALALLNQLASVGQLNQEKMAMRIRLNHTKKQTLEEQAVLKDRVLEIEHSLEDTERARVDINGTIYGGSKIVIGRYTRFVKDPTPKISFRLIDGEIAQVSNFNS
nr:FapA family protein [Paenibacillus turpanensis]